MGQYYYVVNLDKRQYLKPHDLGDGAKLMEFANSRGGTMTALAILLASGNGRGGGDCRVSSPFIGSWAGDRIVIAGDYDDNGKYTDDTASEDNLYVLAGRVFENISDKVYPLLDG